MLRTAGNRWLAWPAAAMVLVALAGCSAGGTTRANAQGAAERFLRAVADHDGRTACTLLVPDARDDVESQTHAGCASGVLTLGLPAPSAAERTRVYGRAGLVELRDTAVFVARSGSSWLVRAAGCTAHGDAPYDCTVDGS